MEPELEDTREDCVEETEKYQPQTRDLLRSGRSVVWGSASIG